MTKCQKEQDDFISTVFTREKKDGTFLEFKIFKLLNINTLTWNPLKMSLKS